MTPQEKQQFDQMKKDLESLKWLLPYKYLIPQLVEFMRAKKKQQITLPLDESSKNIIRAV